MINYIISRASVVIENYYKEFYYQCTPLLNRLFKTIFESIKSSFSSLKCFQWALLVPLSTPSLLKIDTIIQKKLTDSIQQEDFTSLRESLKQFSEREHSFYVTQITLKNTFKDIYDVFSQKHLTTISVKDETLSWQNVTTEQLRVTSYLVDEFLKTPFFSIISQKLDDYLEQLKSKSHVTIVKESSKVPSFEIKTNYMVVCIGKSLTYKNNESSYLESIDLILRMFYNEDDTQFICSSNYNLFPSNLHFEV